MKKIFSVIITSVLLALNLCFFTACGGGEDVSPEYSETYTFNEVLAIGSDDGIKVGAPYVDGATVTAKAIKEGRSKKIIVYKYKPKKGYHKKQGHRQAYTKVQIEKING